jgi:hypothetical protein
VPTGRRSLGCRLFRLRFRLLRFHWIAR